MRGARSAAVAALLACLTAASACQGPVSIGFGSSSRPSVVVAWWRADSSPVAPFAASELARYLTRMSGARVSVQPGWFATAPSRQVAAALVVLTGRAAAAAPAGGPTQLDAAWTAGPIRGLGTGGPDAFATQVLHGDTAAMVAADPRGILYAAYDLLGQLGVRFFAPDFAPYRGVAESVPKRPLALPAYRTAQQAGLTTRTLDLDEGWSLSSANVEALIDWMGKARMNVLAIPTDLDLSHYDGWRTQIAPLAARRGIVLEVGQHGFQLWLPPARYPQYYYYDYNVFDIADEQAVTTYISAVVAYLASRPEIGIFDAWPPDGATWPPAVIDRFGSAANAQAYLVGRLTQELANRRPGVRVETIAYQDTVNPPTAPYGYDPQRNIVDLAMDSRTYAAPISAPANAGSAAALLRWRRAFTGDVGIYEYYRKYSWRSLAFPLGDVVGTDLAWYAQHGATGIRTYAEPGDWITYELTHLVVAAAAWNPGQDPAALVAGYLRERFGAAAGAVGRYVHAAEAAGAAAFGGADPQATLDGAATDYGAAAADLVDAAAFVAPSSPGAFLIQRLGWNADFSLADTRLAASLAAGDAAAAVQARAAGTALLQAHVLDGILLDNPRYAPQYGPANRDSVEYAREYRGGIVVAQPAGTITLGPGATVELELTASAAGPTARRVTWSLDAGPGVAVTPRTGSLAVEGSGSAPATVTITAGRDPRRVHVGLAAKSGDVPWATSGFDVVIADPGDLAPYRDSVAVTSDAALTAPSFDGHGCGYSQQALAAAGLVPGRRVVVDGVAVPWPPTNGSPDNVVATGQQVTLPARTRASRLVLLATATAGGALGAGSVAYADGGRAYYQVDVPDWLSAAPPSGLAAGARVVARGAYYSCGYRTPGPASVYAVEVRVDPTRDLVSVTLPVVFGTSRLHIFGLALG